MTDKNAALNDMDKQHIWQQIEKSYNVFTVVLVALIGIVIAASLTWFMHYLIESSHAQLDKSPRMKLLEFVRLKRDESSDPKLVKPKKLENLAQPQAPDIPQDNTDFDASSVGVNIEASVPTESYSLSTSGYGANMNDGDFLPIVKIAPIYPPRALHLGIEGNCIVTFTVTTTGAVRDAYVVDGECDDREFVRPSVAAAMKFRYKPRVIDGEAVEVRNIKNMFEFFIDEPPRK